MKKNKPLRGIVYQKMILSFLAFIFLFALLNGIVAYIFRNVYEEQVHTDSQLMLSRLGEQLDERAFQQAHALYTDIVSNTVLYPEVASFLQGDALNPVSMYRLYISLRAALARSPEVISSVSLYSRATDAVVSSSSGVKWVQQQREGKYTDWVQEIAKGEKGLFWVYTPVTGQGKDAVAADVSMYASYPSNALGVNARGAVRIQMNLDTLNGILQEYRTSQSTYYLIDRSGREITGTGIAMNFQSTFGELLTAAGEEKQINVFEMDGEKTVVISQPYQQDYLLVAVTSLGSFYEKTNAVLRAIYCVEFVLVALGLLLAAFLSNRLYRPLKQLLEPAKLKYMQGVDVREARDEYAYISALMDDLFYKASSAEAVLAMHAPLIQNGLMQSLLQDAAIDEVTIRERIAFLKLPMPHPYFCVVRLKIPSEAFKKMSMEQKELMLYGLLSGYGEYHHNDLQIYGMKSAPDALTMIVNLTEQAWGQRDVWMREIRGICETYSAVRPMLSVSGLVSSLRDIYKADKEVGALEAYFYFLPSYDYLSSDRIPALHTLAKDAEETVPAQILEDFIRHVQGYQREETLADVAQLVSLCKTGRYDAQHCNQRILSMLFAFSRFVRSTRIATDDPFYERIHSDFLHCDNIDQFAEWFSAMVTHYIQLLSQNASGNYGGMMSEIMDYIEKHLAEPISLELLSDTFGISANYLSRIFKEETGVNYSDFVNSAKLARAAHHLENTAKKIDQIAEETGFNSSAYFIKKFKQKYGVTPKKYRMDAMIRRQESGETEV